MKLSVDGSCSPGFARLSNPVVRESTYRRSLPSPMVSGHHCQGRLSEESEHLADKKRRENRTWRRCPDTTAVAFGFSQSKSL